MSSEKKRNRNILISSESPGLLLFVKLTVAILLGTQYNR